MFDTSLYVTALRKRDSTVLGSRSIGHGAFVWLSAVVLEELYAGARPEDHSVLERLERDFEGVRRLLVPNQNDWTQTGIILSRLAVRYGYEEIGRARLTNDALLATSAARMGVVLLTANQRDFARIAEFRAFSWKVV